MWGRSSKDTETEMKHKEALLRKLSHTVKDIQWVHSQTGQIFSTQESVTSLLTILEAIFLHELKQNIFQTALRNVSSVDDTRPKPSFYALVRLYTHKDTLRQIQKLNQVTNDVGHSRVWIRLAINDNAIASYVNTLHADRLRLGKFYTSKAFLRDREILDTAKRLLEGLIGIPFEIPLNSSLLNTWPTEPLIISGLWSPATRATVQTGVDVVSSLCEDDTSSLLTASSMRSLLSLDESQALRMILDTPLRDQDEDEPKGEPFVPENHQRTYSALLLSCSPMESGYERTDTPEELSSSPNEPQLQDGEVTPKESFEKQESEIILETKEEGFEELFEKNKSEDLIKTTWENESIEQKRIVDTLVVKLTLEKQIFQIPRETNLRDQKFECADCHVSIGLAFGEARLCHLTGFYLCSSCHFNEVQPIPSRIIFNWDHKKYPIGQKGANYLSEHFTQPIFNLHQLNPQLTHVIPQLRTLIQTRRQLNLLHIYLETCKESNIPTLNLPKHLLESSHVFSLSELIKVPSGVLELELQTAKAQARAHVIKCFICSQKGFICEVCRDPQVIYPFESAQVYRCLKCKAVYHGKCLTSQRNCPKCKRKRERHEKINEETKS